MKGLSRLLSARYVIVALLFLTWTNAASASVGDPLILGQVNDGGNQTTSVSGVVDNTRLLLVENTGSNGTGLEVHGTLEGLFGYSEHGQAVVGRSYDGSGLAASSVHGIALGAGSTNGPGLWAGGGSGGVRAESYDTTGAFPAVWGRSDVSTGVLGLSQVQQLPWSINPGVGVVGIGVNGGVRGEVRDQTTNVSDHGIGVIGASGVSPDATGQGIGIRGEGSNVGVHGRSGAGTGVLAESESGVALEVVGTATFSTAGAGRIRTGADSSVVSDPNVTAESIILVTLTSNPGDKSSSLHWVERNPGIGFTIHLTRQVRGATTFVYLILEPGS